MDYVITLMALIALSYGLFVIFLKSDEHTYSQRELDKYLRETLSPVEIGRFYERYIGYLYELEGYDVDYHGALKGFEDLGRDLIVRAGNEAFVIQTKCWARAKVIQENLIFQLYGSMTHFAITSKVRGRATKAVFYTTARFSDRAREVAKVLGVTLRIEPLNRTYPMIKCIVSADGEKTYYLPFDPYYDEIKIRHQQGDFFALTTREAADKGFRRATRYQKAA